MYKTKEEQIQEIVQYFKWAKVRQTMLHLNWPWVPLNRSPEVPELIAEATKLLDEAWEEGWHRNSDFQTSSGGFLAMYYHNNGDPYFQLVFYVDCWETDTLDDELALPLNKPTVERDISLTL
jgi:hypothetical protein